MDSKGALLGDHDHWFSPGLLPLVTGGKSAVNF